MIEITFATTGEIPWLIAHDNHVREAWVRRCVSMGEYLIATQNGDPAGFLRFSWFWGAIPYMNLIYVLPEKRRSGVGSALLESWERSMIGQGANLLMTSSMSDEPEPPSWYRRRGFKESGKLTFGELQPTPEIFFVKACAGL
jgi:GNAT superfamily N-acetyltransferase